MSSEINNLEEIIQKIEEQLSHAESESNALNSGRYKSSSNAKLSKTFVKSFQN